MTPAKGDRPLSDGVVILETPRPDDAEAIVAGQDDAIRAALGLAAPTTRDQAEKWIAQARALRARPSEYDWRFAIRRTDDTALIGWLRLRRNLRGTEGASVECWMLPSYRRSGYARRALSLACRFAFEEYGVPWIEAEIQATNIASQRLAESLGFVRDPDSFRMWADRKTIAFPYVLDPTGLLGIPS